MGRKYDIALLDKMKERSVVKKEKNLDILCKPIPESDEVGIMDPRLYQAVSAMEKFAKMPAWLFRMMNPMKSAKGMYKACLNVNSVPIVDSVSIENKTVHYNNVDVPIRIYLPKDHGENLPIYYYIHGGGFVGGSMNVVEEMCKLLVEQTGFACVSVEYRLAPDAPYPCGLDDCYAVLDWIYDNAASFHADSNNICISGDSAGGNLACVCAIKDRDQNKQRITTMALLYPTLNMCGKEDSEWHYSLDQYTFSSKHENIAKLMIEAMATTAVPNKKGKGGLRSHLHVKDDFHPYLSPYQDTLKNLPPCIIIYGEFDYLKPENEAFARKMKKANGEVKAIRYAGLGHGFADQTGCIVQAEDCMSEIGDFIKKHLR